MKNCKILFILLIFALPDLCGGGNPMTTSMLPQDGDKVTKKHCEYLEVSSENDFWDFSNAVATGREHDLTWFNFGDTLLVRSERGTQLTYQISGDSIFWSAFESPLMEARERGVGLVLPKLQAGDSVVCCFKFDGAYCRENKLKTEGVITFMKSSPGILVLPDDTVRNAYVVSQVSEGIFKVVAQRDSQTVTIDSLQQKTIVDRWYSPRYANELAENIVDLYYSNGSLVKKASGTFICPPAVQEYALGAKKNKERKPGNGSSEDSNRGIGESISLNDNIHIAVGDDRIDVTIDGSHDTGGDARAILSDQLGRVWNSTSGKYGADGTCYMSFETGTLPPGYYILSVTAGEETFVHKFNIKQ